MEQLGRAMIHDVRADGSLRLLEAKDIAAISAV